MGGLALLRNGDIVRLDLRKGEANILISDEELAKRKQELAESGGYEFPAHQTPWQEIQRGIVDQLDEGMVLNQPLNTSALRKRSSTPQSLMCVRNEKPPQSEAAFLLSLEEFSLLWLPAGSRYRQRLWCLCTNDAPADSAQAGCVP